MKGMYKKSLLGVIVMAGFLYIGAGVTNAWTLAQGWCAAQQGNVYPGYCYTPKDQWGNITTVDVPPPVVCINNCAPGGGNSYSCGPANGSTVFSLNAGSPGLCINSAVGNFVAGAGGTGYSWTCTHPNFPFDPDYCSAAKASSNAACGSITSIASPAAASRPAIGPTNYCNPGTTTPATFGSLANGVGGCNNVNGCATWTCSLPNITCRVPYLAPLTPPGVCGPAHGGVFAAAPMANLCSVGSAINVVTTANSKTWNCSGVPNSPTCSATIVPPVAGVCGTANGQTFPVAPMVNLCTTGSPINVVTTANSKTWNCSGTPNSPTCNAFIQAVVPINGACGALHGTWLAVAPSSPPTSNLCFAGTPSAVGGTGPWTWTCIGSNGGGTDSCNANTYPPTWGPQCGLANGGSYPNAAAVNAAGLCSQGTATPDPVTGSGPWNWICTGLDGNVSNCSATQSTTPTTYGTGNCPPLPANAIANIVTSIPQSRSGAYRRPVANWVYNLVPSTTECRFTCAPGYEYGYALNPNYNWGLGSGASSNMGIVGASFGGGGKKQTDGKTIVFSHYMTHYNGTPVNGIVRLNPGGGIDTSFNMGGSGFTLNGNANIAYDYYIEADDKILLVGDFSAYNGTPANQIIRLNADGTIDNTFVYGAGFDWYAQKIKALPNGAGYLIMGWFNNYNGTPVPKMAKLSNTGALDTAFMNNIPNFGGTVYDIEVQSNGQLIVGGAAFFVRLNIDGTVDNSFNQGGAGFVYNNSPSYTPSVYRPTIPTIYDMAVLPDDSIVVGGGLASYNGVTTNNIAKINADGTLNMTFQNNIGAGMNGFVMGITYDQFNDRLMVGGGFSSPAFSFVILETGGTIYPGFPTTGFNDYAPYGNPIDGSTFMVQGNFTSFLGTGVTNTGVAVFGPGCVPTDPCLPEPPLTCDLNDPLMAGVCYYPGANFGSVFYVSSSQGRVGILNTAPTEELDVNGTMRSISNTITSDARLKTSIEKIDNALEKIRQINGYEFTWKKSGQPDIGVLAQEIEKVFAEAVKTDENGLKSVQYTALLAPIIEAIRELNTTIDELATEKFEQQSKRIEAIENIVK